MRRWICSLLLGLLVLQIKSSRSVAQSPRNNTALYKQWASLKQPAAGPAQAIGAYQAGCLAGAVKIDKDGPGYALMRPSRRRFFAHPSLIDYIQDLSARLQAAKMPLLLVGDVSPPRGGPMRNGHNSHQTGLDVDLWLRMSRRRPTRLEREAWGAPSFVRGRKRLRSNWDTTQSKLVGLAADSSAVSRVFVSPAIKKHLCQTQRDAAWLHKIRPWWRHEEHIHVRLHCPANSPACVPQDPVDAKDSGCGKELDWWFSKEADEEWRKIKADSSEREFPELPEACKKIGAD